MICRHCNKNKVNRPRGLCWDCYYMPGVRDLYPMPIKPGFGQAMSVPPEIVGEESGQNYSSAKLLLATVRQYLE